MEETDGRSGMVPALVVLHDCALLTLPLVALQKGTTVGLQRAHVTPMLKNNLLYKFHKHTHTHDTAEDLFHQERCVRVCAWFERMSARGGRGAGKGWGWQELRCGLPLFCLMRGGKLAFRAQICVACKYVLSRQPRRFLIPLDCTTDIELSRELLYTRQGDFSHPELHQRAQETCPHQPRGTKPGEAVFWSQGRLSNKHLTVWVKKKKKSL